MSFWAAFGVLLLLATWATYPMFLRLNVWTPRVARFLGIDLEDPRYTLREAGLCLVLNTAVAIAVHYSYLHLKPATHHEFVVGVLMNVPIGLLIAVRICWRFIAIGRPRRSPIKPGALMSLSDIAGLYAALLAMAPVAMAWIR